MTQLPFTFASTDIVFANAPKRCDSMIGDTARMERLIACIEARAPELVERLGHAGELNVESTDRTHLRTSLLQRLGPARPGEHVIRAVSGGDEGTRYELVLILLPEQSGPRILVSALVFDEATIEN